MIEVSGLRGQPQGGSACRRALLSSRDGRQRVAEQLPVRLISLRMADNDQPGLMQSRRAVPELRRADSD
jgi:hypothetical protein